MYKISGFLPFKSFQKWKNNTNNNSLFNQFFRCFITCALKKCGMCSNNDILQNITGKPYQLKTFFLMLYTCQSNKKRHVYIQDRK